jgi:hypothetical protein
MRNRKLLLSLATSSDSSTIVYSKQYSTSYKYFTSDYEEKLNLYAPFTKVTYNTVVVSSTMYSFLVLFLFGFLFFSNRKKFKNKKLINDKKEIYKKIEKTGNFNNSNNNNNNNRTIESFFNEIFMSLNLRNISNMEILIKNLLETHTWISLFNYNNNNNNDNNNNNNNIIINDDVNRNNNDNKIIFQWILCASKFLSLSFASLFLIYLFFNDNNYCENFETIKSCNKATRNLKFLDSNKECRWKKDNHTCIYRSNVTFSNVIICLIITTICSSFLCNLFFEILSESFVIVFQNFQKFYKKKKINSIYSIDLIEKNISLTQNTIIINNNKKSNKNSFNNNFNSNNNNNDELQNCQSKISKIFKAARLSKMQCLIDTETPFLEAKLLILFDNTNYENFKKNKNTENKNIINSENNKLLLFVDYYEDLMKYSRYFDGSINNNNLNNNNYNFIGYIEEVINNKNIFKNIFKKDSIIIKKLIKKIVKKRIE